MDADVADAALRGQRDPAVLYLNTELMQNYWSSATTVTVLDIDSDVASDDPYEGRRPNSPPQRNSLSSAAAMTRSCENYHAGLVAPFCLSAVKEFFDGF